MPDDLGNVLSYAALPAITLAYAACVIIPVAWGRHPWLAAVWLIPTFVSLLAALYEMKFAADPNGWGILLGFAVGAYTGAVWVAALVVGLVIRRARRGHRRTTKQDRQIRWGA